MSRMLSLLLVSVLAVSIPSHAAEEPEIAAVKAAIARAFPGTPPGSLTVRPSPVPRVYEIEVDSQVLYVSADGKHLFVGDLVDLGTRANLTESRREAINQRLIGEIGEENMIVMGPAKPKRTITVFTDVDCPYCAQLHLEVPELNRHGVKVRYLLFPRTGLDSESGRRSVAVWCAADRVKAVGDAKAGRKIALKDCPNPVARHRALGERLGVDGTPAIFLDNGRRIRGYVPAPRLLALLGLKDQAAQR